VCYTTVYRGMSSLTLTYTTLDSCITYTFTLRHGDISVMKIILVLVIVIPDGWQLFGCIATSAASRA